MKRSWLYRTIPGAKHTPFRKVENGLLHKGGFDLEPTPQQFRWQPMDREKFLDGKEVDFVQGKVLSEWRRLCVTSRRPETVQQTVIEDHRLLFVWL